MSRGYSACRRLSAWQRKSKAV